MYQEKKRSLFFGLPLSFTTYRIEEKVVNIKKGFLRTEEDDTLMYRIQDVKLVTGFLERIFRLGTVVCRGPVNRLKPQSACRRRAEWSRRASRKFQQ